MDVLPGIGAKTAERLADFNIRKVGELAALSQETLVPVFGSHAVRLVRLARGEDPLPVMPFEKETVLRLEHELERDEIDQERIDAVLLQLVEEGGWILRRRDRIPGRVILEVRYADGGEVQGARDMDPMGQVLDRLVFQRLRDLARSLCRRRVAIRRIAVTWARFQIPLRQLSLFPDMGLAGARESRIQKVLDAIRSRYGRQAIFWGLRCPGHG